MNHGKSPGDAHAQDRARYQVISREFVQRGYAVVIPMRMGFAQSGGKYTDRLCNMERNGELQAASVYQAMAYVLNQRWADKDHMLMAGQSHGGLTAIAVGSHNIAGIKGVINFAGGLHRDGSSCDWAASLVDAFGAFGARTKIPSIWFYGENDKLFGPQLASSMYTAYSKAGGKAQLVAYGPFKNNAHGMSSSRDGVAIWWPETERFLKNIGMPTEIKYSFNSADALPRTGYAALTDAAALPYMREAGRAGYGKFLTQSVPRAFALSPSGAWGWAVDGDDPTTRALANCQKNSRTPCKLYAIDDDVVWKE
jgi:dienelactone hydrolase